jgi:DNA-binding NarL/FixJ family response regulator
MSKGILAIRLVFFRRKATVSGIDHLTSKQIKILVVDDHPFMREGIAAAINGQQDMILVGEAATGQEAIDTYRRLRPDVVLMDLNLPGLGGIEAMEAIRSEFPSARIVVLTAYRGDVQALKAFRTGAVGYLLKNMLRKELLDTIRVVYSGRRRIPDEIAAELGRHSLDDELTERELEVLRMVAKGTPNKSIATELGLAEPTIKSHLKNIFQKLAANDRTHAVTIAISRGYIDPPGSKP